VVQVSHTFRGQPRQLTCFARHRATDSSCATAELQFVPPPPQGGTSESVVVCVTVDRGCVCVWGEGGAVSHKGGGNIKVSQRICVCVGRGGNIRGWWRAGGWGGW
jgi:hypothetical protein